MSEVSKYVTANGYDWQETDEEFKESVMIRARVAHGPVMYAVFDGHIKVSDDYGPLGETACIAFAEGYAEAKQDYRR